MKKIEKDERQEKSKWVKETGRKKMEKGPGTDLYISYQVLHWNNFPLTMLATGEFLPLVFRRVFCVHPSWFFKKARNQRLLFFFLRLHFEIII